MKLLWLLLLLVGSAVAQDFNTTLRWMHNTAPYDGSGFHLGDQTIMDEVEVPLTNTCHSFTIVQTTHYATEKPKPDHVWTVSFSLAAIDPNKVRFTEIEGTGKDKGKSWAYVELGTSNDEEVIKFHSSGGGLGDDTTVEASMFFGNPDYAERFANALRHAVTLCGGEVSAF
jgi:hypothetical protein